MKIIGGAKRLTAKITRVKAKVRREKVRKVKQLNSPWKRTQRNNIFFVTSALTLRSWRLIRRDSSTQRIRN